MKTSELRDSPSKRVWASRIIFCLLLVPLLPVAWQFLAFCAIHFLGFDSFYLPGGDPVGCLGIYWNILAGALVGLQISAYLVSRWLGKRRRRSSWQFTILSALCTALIIAIDSLALPEFRKSDMIHKEFALLYDAAVHSPAVVWCAVNVIRFVKTKETTDVAR